jgi:hypothetical protein
MPKDVLLKRPALTLQYHHEKVRIMSIHGTDVLELSTISTVARLINAFFGLQKVLVIRGMAVATVFIVGLLLLCKRARL